MKKNIFFGILILSACTSIAVALPTTTPTLESISGGWSIFHSSEYGFSFQYPAVYDKGFDDPTIQSRFCNIHTEQKDNKFNIRIGLIQITIQETTQSLQEYINEQIAIHWPNGWQVSSKQITADNISGIRLDSIDNNMSRGVITSYFIHNSHVIAIQHYEGSFMGCDPKDVNYSLYWVYEQIVNTLKFDK